MRKCLFLMFIVLFICVSAFGEQVEILKKKINSNKIVKYKKFEITFNLSKEYSNPFEPSIIDIKGLFTSPTGKESVIPAFYYQEYKRELINGETEKLTPIGNPCWKIRFTSIETGKYTYYITVNDGQTVTSAKEEFEVINSNNPGFVRISKLNKHYFEFDNGNTYYPIGHNIRYPKNLNKGTFLYDDYINKMSMNGENWTALWMAPEWLGLEWNKNIPGYNGLGRYNLENAYRIDSILEKASERGIYIILFLVNHGQLAVKTAAYPDGLWSESPYNKTNGGFLDNPMYYFIDQKAKDLFKQLARYIVARWGYSVNIINWSLISELDLTEAYIKKLGVPWEMRLESAEEILTWHEEMSKYIREIDPWKHMISTSFAYMSHGLEIWQSPALDIIESTAFVSEFGDNSVSIISAYNNFMEKYKKPFLVLEFGGRWDANTDDEMISSLHTGIWTQYMTFTAGSTGYWWWDFLDKNNLYSQFKALVDYSLEEDKTKLKLERITPVVENADKNLKAIGLQGKDLAYVWIHHSNLLYKMQDVPEVPAGAVLTVSNLKQGEYIVEFWDTYEGEIKETAKKETSEDGTLQIKLPKIPKDIACKIKLAK